jgi:hypothetical protein
MKGPTPSAALQLGHLLGDHATSPEESLTRNLAEEKSLQRRQSS